MRRAGAQAVSASIRILPVTAHRDDQPCQQGFAVRGAQAGLRMVGGVLQEPADVASSSCSCAGDRYRRLLDGAIVQRLPAGLGVGLLDRPRFRSTSRRRTGATCCPARSAAGGGCCALCACATRGESGDGLAVADGAIPPSPSAPASPDRPVAVPHRSAGPAVAARCREGSAGDRNPTPRTCRRPPDR